MEFARMDSLSRLFPSDLEFQSGRNFIPLLFEIEIQIEKTVDSYWHNTSREVSVYPDTFISAPFLRFSRQIEFDAIFVFLLLPFFFYDRRKEKKTSKRIEINRTLFPKGIDESIRSLCMIDRWHFLDLEENATISKTLASNRILSDELRISTLLEECEEIFLLPFFLVFGRIGKETSAGSLLVFHRLFFFSWLGHRLVCPRQWISRLFFSHFGLEGEGREARRQPGSSANRSGCPFISRRELFAIVGDGKGSGSPGFLASFASSPMPVKYVNSRYLHARWTSLFCLRVHVCVYVSLYVWFFRSNYSLVFIRIGCVKWNKRNDKWIKENEESIEKRN